MSANLLGTVYCGNFNQHRLFRIAGNAANVSEINKFFSGIQRG